MLAYVIHLEAAGFKLFHQDFWVLWSFNVKCVVRDPRTGSLRCVKKTYCCIPKPEARNFNTTNGVGSFHGTS